MRLRMCTGEIVEPGITRVFETPNGDVELTSLRMVGDHTFRGTEERGDALVAVNSFVRRGTYYALMPSEIARNTVEVLP